MSFSVKNVQHDEESITYTEALLRIARLASMSAPHHNNDVHIGHEISVQKARARTDASPNDVTLLEAVGYKSLRTLYAPHSTPRTDTSAMDGFAVNALLTRSASEECPLRLRVLDSIAAGDAESRITIDMDSSESHNVCVEIMTGARFPEQNLPHLDSVIKIEDVILEPYCLQAGSCMSRYIQLIKPVKASQHRRPAGSDFMRGEVIIECGTVFKPKHVAVLASLGYTRVAVFSPSCEKNTCSSLSESRALPRVGVLSTGTEIVESLDREGQSDRRTMDIKQAIPDSNGPYLMSSLKCTFPSMDVQRLGIIRDEEEALTMRLKKAIFEDNLDIIITTGGVSKGRHDLVRYVIETRLQGQVIFHGVKIRPGAPILFASFDHPNRTAGRRRQIAFFGAPGNPLAAAVALRFFIVPYILEASLSMADRIVHHEAKPDQPPMIGQDKERLTNPFPVHQKSKDMTVFKLARRRATPMSDVELVEDQASYKLKGLLTADCWVMAPAGTSRIVCDDPSLLSPL